METISNLIQVNEKLFTSGQPTQEEFELIANSKFNLVINLGLTSSVGKLDREDDIVTSLGMNYIHIPVDFEKPTIKNLNDFLKLLYTFKNEKIWIHCIKNYRVSAFMYVYHKYVLQTPFEEIDLEIFEQWQPSKEWQELMKTPIEELDLSFLN